MFSDKDLSIILEKEMTPELVEFQISQFTNGIPELDVIKPAIFKDGVVVLSNKQQDEMVKVFENISSDIKRIKFVPASGAASRMFKKLFELLSSYSGSDEEYEKLMIDHSFDSIFNFYKSIKNFAFYDDLQEALKLKGYSIEELFERKDIKKIISALLTDLGLNYGSLPKGLLKFHKTECGNRTPVEDHLIEASEYVRMDNNIKLHFTVSSNHLPLFKYHLNDILPDLEGKLKARFDISFSMQKSSTDTIAVNEKNDIFRDAEGNLVFRPGGHGALIENLNDIEEDLVFIKNIDNVVQDRFKESTYTYKKILAGVLVSAKSKADEFYEKLLKGEDENLLSNIEGFMREELCVIPPENFLELTKKDKVAFFKSILNRPMRVCGMVKNLGEPGGGPFWVKNIDGSISLQVVEASQISEDKKHLLTKATHFNPVDLVCAIKNYKGEKFNLLNFVDKKAGFISLKSIEGKTVKALELPGLWNGAMSRWNTIFIEVPLITFNPVKTVNDLLREEHLYKKK